MEDLPFETIRLAAADVQALENTYNALRAKFHVSLPCDLKLNLNDFDLFNNDTTLNLAGVLSVPNPANNCYLAFIRSHIYYDPHGRHAGEIIDNYRYKVWGFINSKKDYGRVLIRRETFADRIVGLIHPVELEFKDDKPFDEKYYVVTNDANKALLAMTWNFRNAIMDIKDKDMVIEITGKTLVIGNNYWLDHEQAIALTEMSLKLASFC
jgi:hypothetical protein